MPVLQLQLVLFLGVRSDMISNLGWRIVLECDQPDNLKEILRKTHYNKANLYNNIPQDLIKKHKAIIELLEKVKNGAIINVKDRRKLKSVFECDIDEIRKYLLLEEEKTTDVAKDKQQISIALTTYVGCKGLSAGYVFAVGLNEGVLPKKNISPTDIEICQMIVILTRTLKKCYLISVSRFAGQKAGLQSAFLRWIESRNFEEKSVNKDYLWDR